MKNLKNKNKHSKSKSKNCKKASETQNIPSSVPQESVQGSLLFLKFLNKTIG